MLVLIMVISKHNIVAFYNNGHRTQNTMLMVFQSKKRIAQPNNQKNESRTLTKKTYRARGCFV